MTQAHKTPGAVVVIKEEWKFDLDWIPSAALHGKWEVITLISPGHLHVRSLDRPGYELPGFHDERFKTYRK